MEKDKRQTVSRLMQTTSIKHAPHERAISLEEAIDQLEREILKVFRGSEISKSRRDD